MIHPESFLDISRPPNKQCDVKQNECTTHPKAGLTQPKKKRKKIIIPPSC